MRGSDNSVRIVEFAFSILLGGNGRSSAGVRNLLHYGALEEAPPTAKVVVVPSGFVSRLLEDERGWCPEIPLEEFEGLPVLFGRPVVKTQGQILVVHIDLVATVFFLLTRYEEILRRDARDVHGRFPARESVIGRAGLSDRPLVDEWGKKLRGYLRSSGAELAEPPIAIRKVYLTHDMDIPLIWHWWRPALGEFTRRIASFQIKEALRPVLSWLGLSRLDPNDCFRWISSRDAEVVEALGAEQVEVIHFIMGGGSSPQDGSYEVGNRLIRNLLRSLVGGGAELGLHASYDAGMNPKLLSNEAVYLREISGESIRSSRHHYLCWREPEDYSEILAAGVRRDFTMGFPDLAGFRLGTCRSYYWFDPATFEVTDLKIVPTTIMDCVLDRRENMNLDYDQALRTCERLIEVTRVHNGDLTLLWHNTELTESAEAKGNYHRALYETLLGTLAIN